MEPRPLIGITGHLEPARWGDWVREAVVSPASYARAVYRAGGIPLVDPTGGFFFVFQAGEPVFQKFDRDGRLLFERTIQGHEVDEVLSRLPTTWPTRKTEEGEMPLVQPTIRTAGVDERGHLWISFVAPFTYVYDCDGDKIRTVQFRAAGLVTPNNLFFGKNDRILVTPGLFEFSAK